MDKKHISELQEIASKIYDYAANQITDYCQKKYGHKTENTMEQQMEDYIVIANEISSYLLGNALALVDPASEEQEIKQFIGNIKKVAEYVRIQQSKALGN